MKIFKVYLVLVTFSQMKFWPQWMTTAKTLLQLSSLSPIQLPGILVLKVALSLWRVNAKLYLNPFSFLQFSFQLFVKLKVAVSLLTMNAKIFPNHLLSLSKLTFSSLYHYKLHFPYNILLCSISKQPSWYLITINCTIPKC